MTRRMAETRRRARPSLVVTEVGQNGSDNVVINHKRPPFDNPAVRRAISLAMDRYGYVRACATAAPWWGAALMPKPWGIWGLPDPELKSLPGYRSRGRRTRREAQQLLAAAGFGPGGKPLRVELVTRTISDLPRRGVVRGRPAPPGGHRGDAVKQIDSAAWFPALARRGLPDRGQPHRRRLRRSRRVSRTRTTSAAPRGTTPTTAARRWTGSSTSSRRSWTAPSASSLVLGDPAASSRPTWPGRCSAGATSTSRTGPHVKNLVAPQLASTTTAACRTCGWIGDGGRRSHRPRDVLRGVPALPCRRGGGAAALCAASARGWPISST